MSAPLIAQVAVPAPVPGLLDYALPIDAQAQVGMRVAVRMGPRRLTGVIMGITTHSLAAKLRPIERIVDSQPVFPPDLLKLLTFAARYYLCPIGEVVRSALPPGARRVDASENASRTALSLTADAAARAGLLSRAPKQRALYECLSAGPRATADLNQLLPGWRDAARALLDRGLLAWVELDAEATALAPLPLNQEQARAVGAVSAALGRFERFVLEGITGSGKTNVYLGIARETLARGQQVLMLVPEIGLTPQFIARVRHALNAPVLSLHSGMADGERLKHWHDAARTQAQVLIGTRSAVFAPLPNLGLILVDEEHDASYKQRDGFRYQARDLAIKRAHLLNCPILLGSATPSLETIEKANRGQYQRLTLSARATGATSPKVSLLDCRALKLFDGLSAPLLDALKGAVERREHAIVFLNRRGFAPVVICHDCGARIECPRCDAALTWHQNDGRLRCHHCGYDSAKIDHCPSCGSAQLLTQGEGTERIEQALQRAFPNVPVVRVDRDTTSRKDGLKLKLASLQADQPGILIGTQMLAKGHDLHGVTLAIILNVDQGLFSADFRASERLAQLIVQVAGRAGRGDKAGHVILQTHHPKHPLLLKLIAQGYRAFASDTLAERRELGLPPYAHHALLRAEGRVEKNVLDFLAALDAGSVLDSQVRLLGPLPAQLKRKALQFRWQLLLECDQRSQLRHALEALRALATELKPAGVRWYLDVDPMDLS